MVGQVAATRAAATCPTIFTGGGVPVGLHFDGLLDDQPASFAFLTGALRATGHFVAVLTFRDPASRKRTEAELAGVGIADDELHVARSLSDKGRLCWELAIDLDFKDQDKCLAGMGEETAVFMICNCGNFDFEERKMADHHESDPAALAPPAASGAHPSRPRSVGLPS
jgi:hypothetical protein